MFLFTIYIYIHIYNTIYIYIHIYICIYIYIYMLLHSVRLYFSATANRVFWV